MRSLRRPAPRARLAGAARRASATRPRSASSTAGQSSANASSASSTDALGRAARPARRPRRRCAGAVGRLRRPRPRPRRRTAWASAALPAGVAGATVVVAVTALARDLRRPATLVRPAAVGGLRAGRAAARGAGARPSSRSIRASSAFVGRVVGRLGRLDQRQLELGAGVGAVLHRAQRGGDQVEQPHDVDRRDVCGLRGEPLVVLGRHAQLGRHLAERLDDHQRARVGLEVAEEAAEVAPGVGQPRRRPAARRARRRRRSRRRRRTPGRRRRRRARRARPRARCSRPE